MTSKGIEKISKIKMVPINQRVPSTIPDSKLRIPSTYAEGEADYEDDEGNKVDLEHATHLRLTARDKRSDLTVGPIKNGGMFRLKVYLDDENHAVPKDEATHRKEIILDENYRAMRY